MTRRSVRLLEVPFNSRGMPNGVALMPGALRTAGLHEQIMSMAELSVEQVSIGVLEPVRGPSGLLAESALVETTVNVRSAIQRAWADAAAPVVVAGDCAALLGALTAFDGDGGLVFIDGHEDAWPAVDPRLAGETSDSELGLAIGTVQPPAALASQLPCVSRNHVVALGARDADEIAEFGADRVDHLVELRDGDWLHGASAAELANLVDATAVAAPAGWWFHVDLDVLSTEALSAVDYPQPGGISWGRLEEVASIAIGRGGCRGASIVIYNPELDGGAAASRVRDFVAFVARRLGDTVKA